jgi:hypothetical protein
MRPKPPIITSVKLMEMEQTADMNQTAIRLICRAMIRLYLRDHGNPDCGNSLGVL